MSEAPERDGDDAPERESEDEDQELERQDEDQGADEDEDEDSPAAARKKQEEAEKRAHNHAAAMGRERSRRRVAERKAQELSERMERLEAARGGPDQDQLLEIIAGLRDDDADPIGDIASVKRALKEFRARQLAEQGQSDQQHQIEKQVENLRGAMLESEEDFATEHADYHAAAKFYRTQRVEELQDAGYSGRALDRKLADDLFGVVRMAIESGQDPAERVYALAQRRGWKAGAKAADAKLDKLQRASDTGQRVTGRGANGTFGWGDVAKMDGAKRDKAWEELRAREKGRRAAR